MMLAQYSLGHRSINFHFGSRKAKAQAWAAAMLDIKDGQPFGG